MDVVTLSKEIDLIHLWPGRSEWNSSLIPLPFFYRGVKVHTLNLLFCELYLVRFECFMLLARIT
jgi:hypothetical protein